jgi:hypothetical protein
MSINIILDALAFRIGHKEVLEEVEEWLEKQRSKESEVYMPPSLEDWNLVVPPIRTIDLTDFTELDIPDLVDVPDTLNSEESVKDSETTEEITCTGCIEDQPNQLAHMHFGGCLYDY